jgi:hypothetical protein
MGKEDEESIGSDMVFVRPDEMVIQFDKGLLDPHFRHADYFSHQDHKREKDFRHNAPQPMREEDILAPQDSEDQEQTSEDHEEEQRAEDKTEKERKRGVDVLQANDRDIPEQKDEQEKN